MLITIPSRDVNNIGTEGAKRETLVVSTVRTRKSANTNGEPIYLMFAEVVWKIGPKWLSRIVQGKRGLAIELRS